MTLDDPWADYADEWDDDPGAQEYAAAAHAHLLELLGRAGPALDGARILDFGAGTGLLTERLAAGATGIHAVDSSPAMLAELDAKIARRGWRHVTSSLSVPDGPPDIDLVVASSVLSFVDDLGDVVQRLVERLRPGGALVHWDWERTDQHDHGLTRDEVRTALGSAGLVDLVVDRAFRFRVEGEAVWPIVGAGWLPAAQSSV